MKFFKKKVILWAVLFFVFFLCFCIAFVLKHQVGCFHQFDYYAGMVFQTMADNGSNNIAGIISEVPLIAHGGGEIDGNAYTDSYQAVLNSVKKGRTLIELDLLLTTDHKIVAAHDWYHFAKIADYEYDKEHEALSYKEFKKKKICGKYDVLDMDKINELFMANKDLILVTDKIRDLDCLSESLLFSKARVIVEIFRLPDYNRAVVLGFDNLALNINPVKKGLIRFLQKNKIAAVTYALDDKIYQTPAFKQTAVYQKMLKISELGISALIYSEKANLDLNFIRNSLGIKNSGIYYN